MSLMPTVYLSTDLGAPSLSGQPGALAALLDALLVDGYGTGENAKAGLGWTREFLSPNKRVYRNNPVSGSGYRLRLDDSNAQYGLLRGFETMVDIDNGANPLPTAAQLANGCLWPKSSAANATERAWFAVGTERCLYLFIRHTGVVEQDGPHFVGDMVSYVPSDQHCFAVSNTKLTTYASGLGQNSVFVKFSDSLRGYTIDATTTSVFVGRNSSGDLGATRLASYGGLSVGWQNVSFGGFPGQEAYRIPPQVNGGVMGEPGLLIERSLVMRGEYPGLVVPYASLGFGELTNVGGRGLLSKRFTCNGTSASAMVGEVIFDLTRSWY